MILPQECCRITVTAENNLKRKSLSSPLFSGCGPAIWQVLLYWSERTEIPRYILTNHMFCSIIILSPEVQSRWTGTSVTKGIGAWKKRRTRAGNAAPVS